MTELTIEEQKEICKGILKRFDTVCKENTLKYSIAYGTLLGAVRHGGFIPWDDDIDVNMPREDYEKLLALEYEDESFKVLSYRYCKNYYYTFSKMIDKRTYIDEPQRGEKNMGIFIDIFPVDYVGDIKNEAPKNVEKGMKNSEIWLRLGSNINTNRGFTPKYIAKLAFRLATLPIRKSLLYRYDTEFSKIPKSEYCANYQLNFYGMKECFKSSLWDDIIYIPFEDIEVAAYRDYDSYLSCVFGDYMTPPPKEDRVSTHPFKAYKK